MKTRVLQATVLGLFGVIAFSLGLWQVGPGLVRSVGWPRAQGTMRTMSVAQQVDGQGHLEYRPSGSYAYSQNGAQRETTCTYGEWTRDYGRASLQATRLRGQLNRTVRLDPSDASKCELKGADLFGTGFTGLLKIMAGILLVGAAIVYRNRRPPDARRCPKCSGALKSYYKFCPACAATLGPTLHRMAV
jgi:hypothetical protein